MAHEMEHYFGLCHINHNGVQNIMFWPPPATASWTGGCSAITWMPSPTSPAETRGMCGASSSTSWATNF